MNYPAPARFDSEGGLDFSRNVEELQKQCGLILDKEFDIGGHADREIVRVFNLDDKYQDSPEFGLVCLFIKKIAEGIIFSGVEKDIIPSSFVDNEDIRDRTYEKAIEYFKKILDALGEADPRIAEDVLPDMADQFIEDYDVLCSFKRRILKKEKRSGKESFPGGKEYVASLNALLSSLEEQSRLEPQNSNFADQIAYIKYLLQFPGHDHPSDLPFSIRSPKHFKEIRKQVLTSIGVDLEFIEKGHFASKFIVFVKYNRGMRKEYAKSYNNYDL